MIDLRKAIQPLIKAIHPSVYFHEAPKETPYPYIVYDIEIYGLGEGNELVTLEIDGWDDNKDSLPLETMLENINNTFKELSIITDTFAITFSLDRILPLSDESDKAVNKRRYVYEGRLLRSDQ